MRGTLAIQLESDVKTRWKRVRLKCLVGKKTSAGQKQLSCLGCHAGLHKIFIRTLLSTKFSRVRC